MTEDDPEKRMRELERGLADVTRPPQSMPPAYSGNASPSTRPRVPWLIVIIVLACSVPLIMGVVMHFVVSTFRKPTNEPMGVPQGGELRVGGSAGEEHTIACNDGKLTLDGDDAIYVVTGHCVGLTVGGETNNVTVDSADALVSTGHANNVTVRSCNNGNLTLSSHAMTFNVTGHCASVTISGYSNDFTVASIGSINVSGNNNDVTVDSTDSINVSGNGNDVKYHSGTPRITDSAKNNNIRRE